MGLTLEERLLGAAADRQATDRLLRMIHQRQEVMEAIMVWLAGVMTFNRRRTPKADDKVANDIRLRLEMNAAALLMEDHLRGRQPTLREAGLADYKPFAEAVYAIVAILRGGGKTAKIRATSLRDRLLRLTRDEKTQVPALQERLATLRDEMRQRGFSRPPAQRRSPEGEEWAQAALRRSEAERRIRDRLIRQLEAAAGGPNSPNFLEIMRFPHLVSFGSVRKDSFHVYWGGEPDHGHAFVDVEKCELTVFRAAGVRTDVKFGGRVLV